MKQAIAVLAAALLTGGALAGTAAGASPAKQLAALQKDVNALKTTVAKQQKTIKTLDLRVNAILVLDVCLTAVSSDAAQSTWATLDQAEGKTIFGPQQAINDRGACSALQITRQGIRNPPTTSVFSALVTLVAGSGRYAALR